MRGKRSHLVQNVQLVPGGMQSLALVLEGVHHRPPSPGHICTTTGTH